MTQETSPSRAVDEMPPLSTPAELSSFLGVSIVTLARWRRNKTGPLWVRVGAQAVRYPRESVHEWLEEHELEPAPYEVA